MRQDLHGMMKVIKKTVDADAKLVVENDSIESDKNTKKEKQCDDGAMEVKKETIGDDAKLVVEIDLIESDKNIGNENVIYIYILNSTTESEGEQMVIQNNDEKEDIRYILTKNEKIVNKPEDKHFRKEKTHQ